MENYYAILGVNPGADPDQIRRAFRERIKLCHPDKATGPQSAETARQLIEAYNHLKDQSAANDVHVSYTPNGSTVYTAAGRTASFYTTHNGHREPQSQTESRSHHTYETAQDFFKDIFGKKASEYINRFRHGSHETPYRSAYSDQADFSRRGSSAAGATAKTRSQEADLFAGASEDAKRAYKHADEMLREVAAKYKRQTSRPRRQWARDYIRDLNIVQIRFRTVATQNPSIYRGAMERLRQIQDLSMEIRRYLQ